MDLVFFALADQERGGNEQHTAAQQGEKQCSAGLSCSAEQRAGGDIHPCEEISGEVEAKAVGGNGEKLWISFMIEYGGDGRSKDEHEGKDEHA